MPKKIFTDETIVAAVQHAKSIGVEPAALLAFAETESNGQVYAVVDRRNEPLIRWECHYFHRRVAAHARPKAITSGLANPKAGAVKNPASQQARWDKLLKPALLIDKQAAYESCSWGMGQVMGSNWKPLGYPSVIAFVEEVRSGAGGQIAVMAKFLKVNGLVPAIKARDWRAAARGYNGPGYAKNQYDTKMAASYAKWSKVDFSIYEKQADPQSSTVADEHVVAVPPAKVEPVAVAPDASKLPPELDLPPVEPVADKQAARKGSIIGVIMVALGSAGIWISTQACLWLGLWCS